MNVPQSRPLRSSESISQAISEGTFPRNSGMLVRICHDLGKTNPASAKIKPFRINTDRGDHREALSEFIRSRASAKKYTAGSLRLRFSQLRSFEAYLTAIGASISLHGLTMDMIDRYVDFLRNNQKKSRGYIHTAKISVINLKRFYDETVGKPINSQNSFSKED